MKFCLLVFSILSYGILQGQDYIFPLRTPEAWLRDPYFFVPPHAYDGHLFDSLLFYANEKDEGLALSDKEIYTYNGDVLVACKKYTLRGQKWKAWHKRVFSYENTRLTKIEEMNWDSVGGKWQTDAYSEYHYTSQPPTISATHYRYNTFLKEWESAEKEWVIHEVSSTHIIVTQKKVKTTETSSDTIQRLRQVYLRKGETLPFYESYGEIDIYGSGAWERRLKVTYEYEGGREVKRTYFDRSAGNQWRATFIELKVYNAEGLLLTHQKMAAQGSLSPPLQTEFSYSQHHITEEGKIRNIFTGNAWQTQRKLLYFLTRRLEEETEPIEEFIYPNPTSGKFRLNAQRIIGKGNLRILDKDDHIIYQQEVAHTESWMEIDLSAQPSGTYKILITDNESTHTLKLVVLH